jgi:1,4-alpha-glucan branching enzyme
MIYELHVDDFSSAGDGCGTFAHVRRRLPYLAGIGFNAIQLMPVTYDGARRRNASVPSRAASGLPVAKSSPGAAGSGSGRGATWGYAPAVHSAVEEGYGSPRELMQLVGNSTFTY